MHTFNVYAHAYIYTALKRIRSKQGKRGLRKQRMHNLLISRKQNPKEICKKQT